MNHVSYYADLKIDVSNAIITKIKLNGIPTKR